jgi:hypothetical protein
MTTAIIIALGTLAYIILKWWREERRIQRRIERMLQDPEVWDKVYAYEAEIHDRDTNAPR